MTTRMERTFGPLSGRGRPPTVDGMTGLAPARRLDALDDDACFRLLAAVPFGRVVATAGALPLVVPVNYALDGHAVVFRTAADGAGAAATRGAVVAFQADDIDRTNRTGWSVVVTDTAEHVGQGSDALRMEQLGTAPWAGAERNCRVRIVPGLVTGRYLTAPLSRRPEE